MFLPARLLCTFAAISTAAFFSPFSVADNVDLGTAGNNIDWLVTGGGATNAPSFQTNANQTGGVSVTSNAFNSGTFVPGGSLASFNGFWTAENTFNIPASATSVSLTFSGFFANDRGRLFLNGNEIGNVDHLGATGNGVFRMVENGSDDPFTFTNITNGTINSGFLLGQANVLTIVVNNTGEASISASTMTFKTGSDATNAFVDATLQFTLAGDVNLDGVVDFFDIQPFINVLSAQAFQAEADIDGNGEVDFFDIQPFINILSGP